MQLLLLLIPWLLAIVWVVSINSILIAILLAGATFVQFYLYKKEPLPFLWKMVTSIMQLFWIMAAFLTNTPYITLGIVLPFAALFFMRTSIHEEQEKHLLLSSNYEQQMALLYELRKQRHDLQKHASALLHSDSSSEEYRSTLHSRYTQIDNILRGESNVVAGALYAYNEQAIEKGVNLEYHIQHAISGSPLYEYEIISFIGNILENSIDAAYDYSIASGQQGTILFSCRKQSGIWIIICKNDSLSLDDQTIDRIFTNRSISTKTGNHEGIGTQEIMRIVRKHNGMLDFSVIENEFTLKIKIPDVRELSGL
ncbi:GHKL domain-containing protein [Bacillus sp. FJAT-49732]|uniref:GHKL domain-containing protein n=1 Tax=Lederbergia citrisecunda TaxID=2833583 RepID=A0A942TRJ5_9BACI|nr:GHKL domain-containing protein [Lederbergia citrisecunda]MBS4202028.1 GHKL domain-containing protein [Lederbergia citrisecunda]